MPTRPRSNRMNNRNNRSIRATIAIGSLLAILAIGIPWTDEYINLGEDASELEKLNMELVATQQRSEQLKELEAKLSGELTSLITRSTSTKQIAAVRDSLVGIIRDS